MTDLVIAGDVVLVEEKVFVAEPDRQEVGDVDNVDEWHVVIVGDED